MKQRRLIDEIYNDGLCLGCGLCESICGSDNVKMELQDNGFFRPSVKRPVADHRQEIIHRICPGINIVNDLHIPSDQKLWGKIEKTFSGYSTDEQIRKKGSSGGVVSAIAVYMLEKGMADAVMQVGGDANDYERNTLKISKSRQEVLDCASSRYAPALIFNRIIEALDANKDSYCFIGKPCDISALKNFVHEFPQYADRFRLMVSIVCAGMPSFKGTKLIIDNFKATEPVRELVYRGNGWPGFFSFKDSNHQEFSMSYNDSWGRVLGKHVHLRCKICPDGIGLQADIAVGDAWETADGYPDFTEREGNSLILGRTSKGLGILEEMAGESHIIIDPLDSKIIGVMQPSQLKRRQRVRIRTLAYMLAKRRKLNYKGTGINGHWTHLKPKTIFKEFYGMFKRSL